MKAYNPNLLIICTQYNEWTAPIYQPFGIFWDQPSRRKIKSISYDKVSNDYMEDYLEGPPPDILLFDEAIDPVVYKRSPAAIQSAISAKESVYLVVHRKHITAYKGWLKALADNKWVSYQQKNSTEGSTVEMLKKLSSAFSQHKPAVYKQLLADYFFGRRIDDLAELQFQLLNSFDQKKFQELAASLEKEELQSEHLKQLLRQFAPLRELIYSLAQATDLDVISQKKLKMARLFWG